MPMLCSSAVVTAVSCTLCRVVCIHIHDRCWHINTLICQFPVFMRYEMCCMCTLHNECRDWCVGSVPDETCSEMWNALWFVRFREPIDTRTHIVMFGHIRHMHASVSITFTYGHTARNPQCAPTVLCYNMQHIQCLYLLMHLTCECECMDIREHAAACLICRVCIALCSACGHCGHAACVIYTGSVFLCTWIRACTPAKFKHIGKRRRMHNVECLQSLRMNKGYVIVTIMYMHWIVVIMCTASSGAGVNLLQHWSNEGDSPVWNLCTFTYGLHTTINILLDWNTNGC